MKLTSCITRSRDSFHWPRLLALALLFGILLFPFIAYDWVTAPLTPTFCPLRAVTGVSCPSCGITRALAHFEHGQWADAVRCHPFVPLVFPLLLALIVMLIFELATGRAVIGNPLRNRSDVWLVFVGLVVFQVMRTVLFFLDGGWGVFWRENLVARVYAFVNSFFN